MNITTKPQSDVMKAIRQIKKEGVSDRTLATMIAALNSEPDFPVNERQRKALGQGYERVSDFAPQDGGDVNYKNEALVKLIGASLGASRATVASNSSSRPVNSEKVAEKFVTENLAVARGWKDLEIIDQRDATKDWAEVAKWGLYYSGDEATRPEREARLVKYDFDVLFVKDGVQRQEELGVAMNRETGQILKVYMNYQTQEPGAL